MMEFVRIEYRPDGEGKENVKNYIIEKMERKGYFFLNEIAVMLCSLILIFEK